MIKYTAERRSNNVVVADNDNEVSTTGTRQRRDEKRRSEKNCEKKNRIAVGRCWRESEQVGVWENDVSKYILQ